MLLLPSGHRFRRRFGHGQIVAGAKLADCAEEIVQQVEVRTTIDGRTQVLKGALRTPDFSKPDARARFERWTNVLVSALPGSKGMLPGVVEVGRVSVPASASAPPQAPPQVPYMVTEWPKGSPLSEIGFRFSPSDAAAMILGLSMGVGALHGVGWAHTALEPSLVNIDLDVLCCGLRSVASVEEIGMTVPGRTPGLYGAPELATDGRVDPRSDVFSLGRLLSRLLTGSDSPRLDDVAAFGALAAVIEHATHRSRDQRYSDAVQFAAAIAKAMGWSIAERRGKSRRKTEEQHDYLAKNPLPETIGPYEIKEVLAIGGEGLVVRAVAPAYDPDLPAVPVVIKAIRYEKQVAGVDRDEWGEVIAGARAQLAEEARSLCKVKRYADVPLFIDFLKSESLDHSIIRAFVHEGIGNEPFLVMQDLAKLPLSEIMPQSFNSDMRLRLIHGLCRNLVALHRRRLAYKDLKPDNVLCDPYGVSLHLVDFGATTPVNSQGVLDDSSPCWSAHTPGFAAPEFILGDARSYDGLRFDVYSLGAMVWWAESGINPQKLVREGLKALHEMCRDKQLSDTEKNAALALARAVELPLESIQDQRKELLARLLTRDVAARPASAIEALGLICEVRASENAARALGAFQLAGRPRVIEDGTTLQVAVQAEFDEMLKELRLNKHDGHDVVEVDRIEVRRPTTLVEGSRLGEFLLVDGSLRAGFTTYSVTSIAGSKAIMNARIFEVSAPIQPRVDARGGPGYVALSWNVRGMSVDAVEIRRGITPLGKPDEGELIGRFGPGDGQYVDHEAVPGTQYCYATFARYSSPRSGSVAVSKARAVFVTALEPPPPPKLLVVKRSHEPILRWEQPDPRPDRYALRWTSFDEKQVLGKKDVASEPDSTMEFTLDLEPGTWAHVFIAAEILDGRSREVRRLVCGREIFRGVKGVPRLEAIELHWDRHAGVQYRIHDLRSNATFDVQGAVFREPREPGLYTVELVALAARPEAWADDAVEIGRTRVKLVSLESVPTPEPTLLMSRRCLKLRWSWADGPALLQRTDAMDIAVLDGQEELWSAHVAPPQTTISSTALPVGRLLEARFTGAFGEERSQTPYVASFVPTSPAVGVTVKPRLGRAVLSWHPPTESVATRVERVGSKGASLVAETTASSIEDIPPRFATPFRWRVTPLFVDGAEGEPRETDIVVIIRPPAEPEIVVKPVQDGIVVQWSPGPGSEPVTGWNVVARGGGLEVDQTVPKTTTSLSWTVTPWEPIDVHVSPMVGDELGHTACARAFGIRPLKALLELSGDGRNPASVIIRWPSEPIYGRVDIGRSVDGSTFEHVGTVRLREGKWRNDGLEYDRKYHYRLWQARKVDGLHMRGFWEPELEVWPRSIPPAMNAMTTRLLADGKTVSITLPSMEASGACDEILILRGELGAPSPPSSTNWTSHAVGDSIRAGSFHLVSRRPLSTATGAPELELEDELPEEGKQYTYTAVSANSERATFGVSQDVTAVYEAPAARVVCSETGADFVPKWEGGAPGPLLLVRRSWTGQRRLSRLPPEIRAPSRTHAVKAIERALMPETDALVLIQQDQSTKELRPRDALGTTNYSAHRLVRRVDIDDIWCLSAGRQWFEGEVAHAVVLYEVRRAGLFGGRRLWWWSTKFRGESLELTFSDAGKTWTIRANQERGSLRVPNQHVTLVRASIGGSEVPVAMGPRLFPARNQRHLAKRMAWLESQTWCEVNAPMVSQILSDLWDEHVMPQGPLRGGRWRFSVPSSRGRGWLELRPNVQNARPVAQLRHHTWWLFGRVLEEISCRDETWLKWDRAVWNGIALRELAS